VIDLRTEIDSDATRLTEYPVIWTEASPYDQRAGCAQAGFDECAH